MRKIVNMNPENTKQYLTPDSKNMLMIIMGIKLALSVICAAVMAIGDYPLFSAILLRVVMFSLVYDICSFYQVCLQIAQSYFMGFLLFLVLLLGGVFLFDYCFSFLATLNPSTEAGQNASMIVMALICLIPFVIDMVRLARFCTTKKGRRTH